MEPSTTQGIRFTARFLSAIALVVGVIWLVRVWEPGDPFHKNHFEPFMAILGAIGAFVASLAGGRRHHRDPPSMMADSSSHAVGRDVNIRVQVPESATKGARSTPRKARPQFRRLEPTEATTLLRRQIEHLQLLRPTSLEDPEWGRWRSTTAELLHQADPSKPWSNRLKEVAADAIGEAQTAELFATETDGLETQCENLRRAERALLESAVELLSLEANRKSKGEQIQQARAHLASLKARLERDTNSLVDEQYVEEFHTILERLEKAAGDELSNYRLPDSKLRRLPSGHFSVPRVQRRRRRQGQDMTWTKERYCDRDFLLMRVDTVSRLFEKDY